MATLRDVNSTQDAELRIAFDTADDVYQRLKNMSRITMESRLMRDLAAIVLEAIDCIEALDTANLSSATFKRVFVYASSEAKSPLLKLGYSLTVLLERLLTDRFALDSSSDDDCSPPRQQPSTSRATRAFNEEDSVMDDVVKEEPADCAPLFQPIQGGREIKEEPIEEPIADTFCPTSGDPIGLTLGEFLKKSAAAKRVRTFQATREAARAVLVPSMQPVQSSPLFKDDRVDSASPVEIKEEPLSDVEEAPELEVMEQSTSSASTNGVVHMSSISIKEAIRNVQQQRKWKGRHDSDAGPSNAHGSSALEAGAFGTPTDDILREEPAEKLVGAAKRKRHERDASPVVNTELVNIRALDLRGLTSSTSEGCIDDPVTVNQLYALKKLAKPVSPSRICEICGEFTDKFEGTPPAPEKRDLFLKRIIATTQRDKEFVADLRQSGDHAWICKKHLADMQLIVKPATKKTRWCDFCTSPVFPCRHSPTEPVAARLFFKHVVQPNPYYSKKIEWFLTHPHTRATICRKHIADAYKAKLDADDEAQRKRQAATVREALKNKASCPLKRRLDKEKNESRNKGASGAQPRRSSPDEDDDVNVGSKYKLRVVNGVIQFDESQKVPIKHRRKRSDPEQPGPSGVPSP